jgi:adenylate kinase
MSLYVILMGVQGAGKGEQARFIQENYGIPQVSTGDLFRAMKTRTDALAQRIQQMMAEGKLIDDETTNTVVEERLAQPDAKGGVLLDGYPRTPAQAQWLDAHLAKSGAKINTVLLLEIDLYTAFKRSFGRISSDSTKRSYNIYFNDAEIAWSFEDNADGRFPPRLNATLKATGEALKRRPDDASAHAVIKRIDTYLETTQPLIDYYRSRGLVQRIFADQPIAVVNIAMKFAIDTSK